MFPDMKTVFFSHILTDLVCTVFMVFLWYRNRKRFDGLTLGRTKDIEFNCL